jgi:hypothetical protein
VARLRPLRASCSASSSSSLTWASRRSPCDRRL